MWLLIIFIVVWALSPGPVAVLTMHQSRKDGIMAGVSVSGGATITSILMVLSAIALHLAGFSTLLEAESRLMTIIERLGATGIIFMGLYAGYKVLLAQDNDANPEDIQLNKKVGLVQGMMVMATYIPQALVYYNVIVPQTIEPQSVIMVIIILGSLKVGLIFFWHSMIAVIAAHSQNWTANKRYSKVLEIATACLIVGLGINILI